MKSCYMLINFHKRAKGKKYAAKMAQFLDVFYKQLSDPISTQSIEKELFKNKKK